MNGTAVTKPIFISFALMVLSSVVAGYADIAGGNFMKPGAVSSTVAYGWMVFNCLSTAALTLTMRATQKKVNFKDFDTAFYNSTLVIDIPFFPPL